MSNIIRGVIILLFISYVSELDCVSKFALR